MPPRIVLPDVDRWAHVIGCSKGAASERSVATRAKVLSVNPPRARTGNQSVKEFCGLLQSIADEPCTDDARYDILLDSSSNWLRGLSEAHPRLLSLLCNVS